MKRAVHIIITILILSWGVAVVFAQTTGRQPVSESGAMASAWSADASQEPQLGKRQNTWLQGDERQQEQLMGCYRLASDIEHHERFMRKLLLKNPIDWPNFRTRYTDLKRGVQLLFEKHEEYVSELNTGQRSWWEARLRNITASEFKLSARMGAIEGELKEDAPSADSIRTLLVDLEMQFKDWKDCYDQMAADMDIENLGQKSTGKIKGLSGPENH